MPALTYPGVYIEEVPSGVRTITGVATSIALFIGWAPRGPVDRAVRLSSYADFVRNYGGGDPTGLDSRSLLGYAVRHFYDNGGADAYVLRIAADDADTAACAIGDLDITASSSGDWSSDYQVRFTPRADDATRFRIDVLHVPSNNAVAESFENLSMTTTDARFVEAVINGRSAFIAVDATGTNIPNAVTTVDLDNAQAGSVGTVIGPADAAFLTALLLAFDGDSTVVPVIEPILDAIDLFNILCVPGLLDGPTIQALQQRCAARRAFLIVDPDENETVSGMPAALAALGITGTNATNAAIYFPWVRAPDPLQQNALRAFPPCGFVAGIYARTDGTRGVWKAPAGSEASITGAAGLGDHDERRRERPAQPARHQLPAHHARSSATSCGARARCRARRSRLGVEVHAGAAAGAVHRGEPLPRHAVGGVRAQRRAAVGADPAERRGVHAEPVPPGRVPGRLAARGVLRQVRPRDDHAERHQPRHRQHPRRLRAAEAGRVRRHPASSRWPGRSQA